MPIPTLGAISGDDITALIESLEKQRKELEFVLSSLDSSNVLELNAEVINAGQINAKHISISSETTFATGYDTSILRSEVATQFTVIDGEISARVLQTDFDAMGQIVASHESSLSVLPGMIESKVSYTDYTGNVVVSMINQTATTIKLKAENIEMDGIVRVADRLTIGAANDYSTEKNLSFRNGAYLSSPPNTDSLEITSIGGYLFLSGYVKFGSYYGGNSHNVDFSGANVTFSGADVTGLNYSPVNHSHSEYSSPNSYVKPSSGQAITLGAGPSTLNVYLDGSLKGTIPYS